MYQTLKLVHVGAVALSATGFVLRYGFSRRLPHSAALRVAPHVVDTILLASALVLVWLGGWRPLEMPWLQAKIIGLVLYIGAGTFALKRGRTLKMRATAFAIAIGIFIWLISVAVTKSPWGLIEALR